MKNFDREQSRYDNMNPPEYYERIVENLSLSELICEAKCLPWAKIEFNFDSSSMSIQAFYEHKGKSTSFVLNEDDLGSIYDNFAYNEDFNIEPAMRELGSLTDDLIEF